MSFASPALRTSHALIDPSTRIEDRGPYARVLTPSQPNFYFGNLLAFHAPPGPADAPRWREILRGEFAGHPLVRHETFVWEGGDPHPAALAAFRQAGFDYQHDEMLAADSVPPPARPATGVTLRTLESDHDWRQAREFEGFEPPTGVPLGDFRRFQAQRAEGRRRLVAAGLGRWFGAFLPGGELVSNLGLFAVEEFARYQSVTTLVEFRRRGLAGSLVHAAAERIAAEFGPRRFLLVADPAGPAIGLYRSLGFATLGRTWALFRPPGERGMGG